jgi:hypothetical protein
VFLGVCSIPCQPANITQKSTTVLFSFAHGFDQDAAASNETPWGARQDRLLIRFLLDFYLFNCLKILIYQLFINYLI